MKKLLLILTALAAFGAVGLFGGCSDDDDAAGPTQKPLGDTLDVVLLAAGPVLGEAANNVPRGIESMFQLLGYVVDSAAGQKSAMPAREAVPYPYDSVYYDSVKQYWFGVIDNSYICTDVEIDSVRLLQGAAVVQWPDTLLLTAMNGGTLELIACPMAKTAALSPQALDTFHLYQFQGNISGPAGSIWSYDTVTAAGNGKIIDNEQTMKEGSVYCLHILRDTYSAQNIVMDLDVLFAGGCPVSGSVTHNINLTLDCMNDTTFTDIDNWYVRQTFSGDSTHLHIENSHYYWEISDECGGVQ